MSIQRNSDEIIIKISDSDSRDELLHLLDYLRLRIEDLKDLEEQPHEVDLLARALNQEWWEENKDIFLNP